MPDLTPEELALFGETPADSVRVPDLLKSGIPALAAEDDGFGWDDEPAPVKSAMPGHDGATVADGPGWAFVECSVCGMPMTKLGKRPPGHKIDPSQCPNVKSHDAAVASAAKLVPSGPPPAGVPIPSATEPVPESVPTQTPAPSVVAAPAKRGRKAKDAESAAPAPVVLVPGAPTLRDQFAMAALVALAALPLTSPASGAETAARTAYDLADAMLAARG